MSMTTYPSGPKESWEDLARRIDGGLLVVKPVQVIGWLQDYNWPGASTIARFLRRHELEDLRVAIELALDSGDDIWCYWTVSILLANRSSADLLPFIPRLKVLLNSSEEDLVSMVQELLARASAHEG